MRWKDLPPVKEVVAGQKRSRSRVAVDSLRGTEVAEFSTKMRLSLFFSQSCWTMIIHHITWHRHWHRILQCLGIQRTCRRQNSPRGPVRGLSPTLCLRCLVWLKIFINSIIKTLLTPPDVDQMTLGMVWLPNWLRSNSPGKKMSSLKSPKSAYSGTCNAMMMIIMMVMMKSAYSGTFYVYFEMAKQGL